MLAPGSIAFRAEQSHQSRFAGPTPPREATNPEPRELPSRQLAERNAPRRRRRRPLGNQLFRPFPSTTRWRRFARFASLSFRPPRRRASLLGPLFKEPGFDTPPVPPADRTALLESLASVVSACRKCAYLAETRTQTVFGTGPPQTRLMFIGEAPGADEDRQGKPFVGRAGQLLTDMITKGMGLSRDDVFIANVLKCRPPENRTPTLEESDNCIGYLEHQIAIIRPEFICLLGKVALQGLLKSESSMGRARGKWYYYKGIPTIVTYHPSYLLRKPDAKREVWEDLQMLMKEMGLKPPERKPRVEE